MPMNANKDIEHASITVRVVIQPQTVLCVLEIFAFYSPTYDYTVLVLNIQFSNEYKMWIAVMSNIYTIKIII